MATFKDVKNKNLNSLTSLFPPNKKFLHRDKEIDELVLILQPVMSGQRASHFFIYGATGTGKTGILRAKLEELEHECKKDSISFAWVYVNCAETITSTNSLLKICKQISPSPEGIKYGHQWGYVTGLFESLVTQTQNLVVVLDEVDKLIEQEGDKLLYYLTRLKDQQELSEQNVTVITISNNVNVPAMLSPRTESSFGKLKVEFFSYNAIQLTDILAQRISEANISGSIGEGVIERIAAYGAQLHGNARQTLELLKNCYLAAKNKKISMQLVEEVYEKIEHDLFIESVSRLPSQQKIFLYGVMSQLEMGDEVTTRKAYEKYNKLCKLLRKTPVSLRRAQQVIKELQEAGIVETNRMPGLSQERLLAVPCPAETFKRAADILRSELVIPEREIRTILGAKNV